MHKAFISVIIPSYNEEAHIANCLGSIMNCDYPKNRFEIILVDNGSTDNTVDIARKYKIVILVAPNKTIGGLRNLGVKNARGNILGFLDADCTVSPKWLEKAEQVFKNHEIGVVGSRLKAPDSGNWLERSWTLHLLSKSKDGKVKYINSGNCFVKRDVFNTVGGFSEILETNEDVDLCDRIKAIGYHVYHDEKISAVHWGYPKTIKQFFKREIWHGIGDSRRNMHRFWKSNPVLLAFYNIIIITMLFVFFLTDTILLIPSFVLLFFLPPALLASLLSLKTGKWQFFPSFFVLYCLYGVARSISFMIVAKENAFGYFQ